MTRGYSADNQAQLVAQNLHQIALAKLEFDTPVYVHTGIGIVNFDSNDYLGVGDFGSVEGIKESEVLGPNQITLTLSGIDAQYVNEALNSANYGDAVTIYEGYRQDDGSLVDEPEVIWAGTIESANVSLDAESSVQLICTHELAVLDEKDNGRFSEEDQKADYSGDLGFDFIADVQRTAENLLWGGGPVPGTAGGRGARPRSRLDSDRDGVPDDQR